MARRTSSPSPRGTRGTQNKRPTTTKRRTKKQILQAQQRKAAIIGFIAIAFLLVLVSISVVAIKGDKSEKPQVAKSVEKPVAPKPIVQEPKPTVTQPPATDTKSIVVQNSSEDLAALIRLVLFDYEISRASVEERTSAATNGDKVMYFDIKNYDSATYKKVMEALKSVLTRKNYKVSISNNKLVATALAERVEIVFHEIKQAKPVEQTKKPATTQKSSTEQPKPVQSSRMPTPPTKSDVVVKLAILLDDGGYNLQLAERFVKMKYPVGLAVLPNVVYTKETARLTRAYNKTLFLHFPMQPKSYPATDPGEGAALLSMPEILISGVTKMNMDSIGLPIDGVNNHMGSAITEDSAKMAQIMSLIKPYTNVFVDSYTSPDSVAYAECVKANMSCGVNKKFLDNDNDVDAIVGKIYEAAEQAKKNGESIAIGHLRENTLIALEYALPILEELNITIVPITSVVH